MSYLDPTVDTVRQVLDAHESQVDAGEALDSLNIARIRDVVNQHEDAEDRARAMDAEIEEQLVAGEYLAEDVTRVFDYPEIRGGDEGEGQS